MSSEKPRAGPPPRATATQSESASRFGRLAVREIADREIEPENALGDTPAVRAVAVRAGREIKVPAGRGFSCGCRTRGKPAGGPASKEPPRSGRPNPPARLIIVRNNASSSTPAPVHWSSSRGMARCAAGKGLVFSFPKKKDKSVPSAGRIDGVRRDVKPGPPPRQTNRRKGGRRAQNCRWTRGRNAGHDRKTYGTRKRGT